jgi:hypothetical protein
MKIRKGSKLISMALTVCLFFLGFGMVAGANVNAQHKRASEMGKKKEGKRASGKKAAYHHKNAR